jgi:hypothetical protein
MSGGVIQINTTAIGRARLNYAEIFLYVVTLVKLISCGAAADIGISEWCSVRAFVLFLSLNKTEVVLDASIDRTNISRIIF